MYEMAPATTAPARALAVPGEAHRAGPHLAQALDDVLVRQVVAARLRVAVLVNLAAEPRRDRGFCRRLAERGLAADPADLLAAELEARKGVADSRAQSQEAAVELAAAQLQSEQQLRTMQALREQAKQRLLSSCSSELQHNQLRLMCKTLELQQQHVWEQVL